ncbi:MAG: hypothetical protein H7A25_00610 [Leptospiraceae bacterium]|nr:hypothetical protein [Leptospiraceae bacterium]MCP5498378.1 hypothetical protein [Leptospiraceae bacterium]
MKVLCDTSSALLLYRTELFILFAGYFEVCFTEEVYFELQQEGYYGYEFFKEEKENSFSIVKVKPLNDNEFSFLHTGEASIIQAYQEGRGDFVLLDDFKGARYCRDKRIPYTSALLIPKILYYNNLINQDFMNQKTSEIIDIGRYSKKIISYAENANRDNLKFFL